MAGFKTHVTLGLITGYITAAIAVIIEWIMAPFTPICMFAAAFIGSFLPDLDSDHGKSFNIVFSFFSVIGGSVVFLYFLREQTFPWMYWIAIPPLIAVIIRYGFGRLFQKITIHRGIFHSIPALFIVTLATPIALASFDLATNDIVAISISLGIGFLSHLALDETYSIVDFKTMKIKPKRSLGTAMTFMGPSIDVTIMAYALVGALVFYNWDLLIKIAG